MQDLLPPSGPPAETGATTVIAVVIEARRLTPARAETKAAANWCMITWYQRVGLVERGHDAGSVTSLARVCGTGSPQEPVTASRRMPGIASSPPSGIRMPASRCFHRSPVVLVASHLSPATSERSARSMTSREAEQQGSIWCAFVCPQSRLRSARVGLSRRRLQLHSCPLIGGRALPRKGPAAAGVVTRCRSLDFPNELLAVGRCRPP